MSAKAGDRETDCVPSTHSQTTLGCATRRRRVKHDKRTKSDTDEARRRPVRGGNPQPDIVDQPVADPLPNSFDAENDNDAAHPVQLTPNPETARRAHTDLIVPYTDVEVVLVPQVELPRPDDTIRQQQEGQGAAPYPIQHSPS